jgi:hypothetical protein
MKAFLNPVEKPMGIGLKIAYYFNKKQFGKTRLDFPAVARQPETTK